MAALVTSWSHPNRASFCPHVSSSAACLQTIFTSAFPFTLTCLDEYCVCNEQQVTLQIRLRGKSKLERLSSQSRRTLASHVVPRSTGDPRSLHSVSLPNSSGQICTTAPDPAGWIHPQRMAMMQSAVPPCHPYDRNQLFGSPTTRPLSGGYGSFFSDAPIWTPYRPSGLCAHVHRTTLTSR